MTPDVRPLVAGNWKMNGAQASLGEIAAMRAAVDEGEAGVAELAVCPPATLIAHAAAALAGARGRARRPGLPRRGRSGAFTGDISAEMLKDAGCAYVIVGHSERRAGHGETDAAGEGQGGGGAAGGPDRHRLRRRDPGRARRRRRAGGGGGQVRGSLPEGATPATLVVAYEPVWAIGTGLTPTAADVAEMHASIRALLVELLGAAGARMRILYGGSVKPANARELLGAAQRRRRAGRRREPEGRRFPRHRRRLSLMADAAFWDERYDGAAYAYGEAPNAFLASLDLPRGGRALVPGDGEGRNGVFLAERGFAVETLDLSAAGRRQGARGSPRRAASRSTRGRPTRWPGTGRSAPTT